MAEQRGQAVSDSRQRETTSCCSSIHETRADTTTPTGMVNACTTTLGRDT